MRRRDLTLQLAFAVVAIALVCLLGAGFGAAPRGVYAVATTFDSLDVVSSGAQLPTGNAVGLLYPDTTGLSGTIVFELQVSRDNTTWYAVRDTSDALVFISNKLSARGFVDLTTMLRSSPRYARVALSAGDTARATVSLYFTVREGG